jgi:FixJ family two-component response regulator
MTVRPTNENERADIVRAQRTFKLLSARQRDVLQRAVAGDSNNVIASHLQVSQKTVETHRARAMQKMEVGSFAELVRLMVLARLTRDWVASTPADAESDPRPGQYLRSRRSRP